jgi:hypothetical protein
MLRDKKVVPVSLCVFVRRFRGQRPRSIFMQALADELLKQRPFAALVQKVAEAADTPLSVFGQETAIEVVRRRYPHVAWRPEHRVWHGSCRALVARKHIAIYRNVRRGEDAMVAVYRGSRCGC